MSNVIRFAEPKDIPQIAELVTEWAEQYGLNHDLDSITNSLAFIISQGVAIVVEERGTIKGTLLGLVHPALFNKEILQFQEIMLYVLPKYRTEGIGRELMRGLDNIAKENGINQLSMVAPMGVKPEKLDKFYNRLGYKKFETTYIKEI